MRCQSSSKYKVTIGVTTMTAMTEIKVRPPDQIPCMKVPGKCRALSNDIADGFRRSSVSFPIIRLSHS
jgi:hypothetical protein